jgi:hypothetical protein
MKAAAYPFPQSRPVRPVRGHSLLAAVMLLSVCCLFVVRFWISKFANGGAFVVLLPLPIPLHAFLFVFSDHRRGMVVRNHLLFRTRISVRLNSQIA